LPDARTCSLREKSCVERFLTGAFALRSQTVIAAGPDRLKADAA
jgi:hypothetical protein